LFIWKGDIFRVPLPTLQSRKEEGGWDLINLQVKSLTLFLYRMRIQGKLGGTLSAEWMRKWTLTEQSKTLHSERGYRLPWDIYVDLK